MENVKYHLLEIKPDDVLVIRSGTNHHGGEEFFLLEMRDSSVLKVALKVAALPDDGNGKTIVVEEFPVDFLMQKFSKRP